MPTVATIISTAPRPLVSTPALLPAPSLPPGLRAHHPHLPQTQTPHLLHQPTIRILNPPLPQTHLALLYLHQHIFPGRILSADLAHLRRRTHLVRVRRHEHLQQRRHRRIMLRVAHRCAARRAGVRRRPGRRRRAVRGELPAEPFLKTGAAERVQAVEQREGLVQHFGANLRAQSPLA